LAKYKPNKTDLKFDKVDYSLFASAWIILVKPLLSQYKVTLSDCRLMCGIEALIRLYGHRLNGEGVTAADIGRITSFHRNKVTRMLLRLHDAGLIQYTELMDGIHHIRYYKFTKRGKEVVNKLCDTDKVNEAIISHLYNKRLLR
jgi:predicted transcriptional regulator